ncbi:hypothetical protein [Thalassospira sp. TSL5-1]|uniref:hypothetical protein n=1 Tax=Thalassospira sp. TSL5-1 TaxID=1544451 RepID=UPI00093A66DA|nr:hypothetical protein [Thalassospira sp. TSL5-1]OKH87456.1 hypothetical protein LF95_11665 [Thalassospira sp. TSL5-1]
MKKLIVGIVVLGVVVAGGGFYWTQQQAKQQRMANHFQPSPAQLYTGIADQVTPVFDLHGYKIAMLVPGDRTNGDSWVFRGTARSGNLSPAYYGQVDYTCGPQGGDEDACWKLSQLVVDGRPLKLVGTVAENGDASDTPDETAALESRESQALGMTNALDTAMPGDGAVQPVAPDASGAADRQASDGPADETAQATADDDGADNNNADQEKADVWRTTSDNVNARMGPGTDYEVAFAMPQSTPMQLLEQKDGWGHFSYVGPDGNTYRVWIYMNLVAKD